MTACLEAYDYAAAKSEIETFFWRDLADNYLEMAKQRLYDRSEHPRQRGGALYAVPGAADDRQAVRAVLALCDRGDLPGLIRGQAEGQAVSIHLSPGRW